MTADLKPVFRPSTLQSFLVLHWVGFLIYFLIYQHKYDHMCVMCYLSSCHFESDSEMSNMAWGGSLFSICLTTPKHLAKHRGFVP